MRLLYRLLLCLCPAALRRDYGTAMEETFARRLADAHRHGRRRLIRVGVREAAGLIALAVSERGGAAARVRRRNQTVSAQKAGAMDALRREISHAARRLVKSPSFTAAVILTLALAIGANASIFAVVQRVLLNPLPFGDPDRLIVLDYAVPARNVAGGFTSMSWQLYFHLADHAKTLDGIAVYTPSQVTLTGEGTPQRVQAAAATPSLASVLRVRPALGRWFTDEEGVPGGAAVAVLSHGLWTRRFGADAGILDRPVSIDGVPTTIVGVLPATLAFPMWTPAIDLWTPARSSRATASFLFTLTGLARLRDGVTIGASRAEMTALIEDLSRTAPNQRGIVSAALPLHTWVVGRVASALWILLASVGLVLLVACANVSNLFLVRSDARQRDVAVRRALGAGRAGVAGYFLSESALLSIAGGAIGLGIAWAATRLLVAFGPTTLPRLDEVRLDAVVVAFTALASLFAAAAFGAIPLLRSGSMSRTLHDHGRSNTASRGQHRARQLLMAGQVALALVLVVFSGLMIRSFQKLRAIDPGFDATSALTFRIGLPPADYPTRRAAVAVNHTILDRLSALPGVSAAAASTCLPLSGACFGNAVTIEGRPADGSAPPPIALFRAVSGEYLQTMRMRIVRGRAITRGDVERGEPVVVVNQTFADTVFPNQDPIGRRIKQSNRARDWLTVVGVVANTPTNALAEPNWANLAYMPMSIAGGPDIPREDLMGPNVATMTYVVRTAMAPEDLTGAVREAIGAIDRNLALWQVEPLSDLLNRASEQMAFTMTLIAIAASVALMLGIVGIYGVMSYIVSQRTGEIGVRLALGAQPGTVARMIVRQGGIVAIAGIGAGLAAAYAGSRLMTSLLYRVSPRDPGVFAVTTITLLAVALVACWLPARRAARLSPVEALRTD